MPRSLAIIHLVVALMVVGCGPVAKVASEPRDRGPADAAGPPKTITLGATRPIKALGPWDTSGSGGTFTLNNIHSASLITTDGSGNYRGSLLSTLPSLDDGTILALTDGRMQTTWKLRPSITWHDGAPFTAEDLAFTREVLTHPELPVARSVHVQTMERIDVVDPLTAVVTWKTTFYQPLYLGLREFWPLPKHVLGDAFQGEKTAFTNLPYWTTEYVNLGPFRLVEFGMGETLVLERFENFFLGRPKVDKVVIRIIPDANALFANLQARAVDVAADSTFSNDAFIQLRDEWKQSGGGVVVERQADWPFLSVQFNPEWGRPPELSRDVRLRRGLYRGFDREELRSAILPGIAGTDGNSFMPDADPRARVVGKPFARFEHDPTRAAQELAEGGWRRAADGRLVNAAGEQITIAIRASSDTQREMAIVAQSWRQLGINTTEEAVSGALSQDKEYEAKFPGVITGAHGSGDFVFGKFHSREAATPQNRYTGRNTGGYSNPTLDRLIDQLFGSIDEREQGLILRELGEVLANDLPVFPLYFRVKLAAVTSGVRAFEDFAGTQGPGLASRSAHLWDRD